MEGGVTYFALRCFSCQMFQVNRKTKSGKWKCSVCGEGQSAVKVWGRGDRAKDVRRLVMELNAAAGRGEDLTSTLRKAAAAAATSASLPPPHQTCHGRDNAAFASFSRHTDPHDRAALSTDSGTALQQPRRFAKGMPKARRFAEGMAEPRGFGEGMADALPVDTRQARFDEPAPLGFTSGRDISRLDSMGARAGEGRGGGGMGERVWHERQNADYTDYTDDALSGAMLAGGSRARESVGSEPFREQASLRQSTIEATDRGSKVSRWGEFASNRGVGSLETHRGQREFDQQMKGDPSFVTSLPKTAAPSTHRRGGPTNGGNGRIRAFSSTAASMDQPRAKKSGRREGQTDAAHGRAPVVGQAQEGLLGGEQQMTGRDAFGTGRDSFGTGRGSFGTGRDSIGTVRDSLGTGRDSLGTGRDSFGTGRGEDDVCGGRRGVAGGSSGASSGSRVFVGELDNNACYSGTSRVSGANGSAGVHGGKAKPNGSVAVDGGKAKPSRWSNFV